MKTHCFVRQLKINVLKKEFEQRYHVWVENTIPRSHNLTEDLSARLGIPLPIVSLGGPRDALKYSYGHCV